MKLHVTKEHIRKAQKIRGQAWVSSNQAERECPLAQALRLAYPNARVSHLSIVLDGNPKGAYVMLPEEAQKWVQEFDATGYGKPLVVDLD